MPRNRKVLSDSKFGLICIIPVAAVIFGFTLYPFAYAAYMALHEFDLTSPNRGFLGFQNFLDVIRSYHFIGTWQVTLIFTISVVIVVAILSTAFALLLSQKYTTPI